MKNPQRKTQIPLTRHGDGFADGAAETTKISVLSLDQGALVDLPVCPSLNHSLHPVSTVKKLDASFSFCRLPSVQFLGHVVGTWPTHGRIARGA